LTPSRTAYDTDLTDAEWESLVPLVPPTKAGGRPPKHSRREILNGIFYAVRSGGAWKGSIAKFGFPGLSAQSELLKCP
jgi:transposase